MSDSIIEGIAQKTSVELSSLTGLVIKDVVQVEMGTFLILSNGKVLLIENHSYSDEDLFEALSYEMKEMIHMVRKYKKISAIRRGLKKQLSDNFLEESDDDSGESRGLKVKAERVIEEGS